MHQVVAETIDFTSGLARAIREKKVRPVFPEGAVL